MSNNRENFSFHSAQSLCEDRSQIRMRDAQKRREQIADITEANLKSIEPMVNELKALVKETQEQNEILQAQLKAAEESAIQARKDARNAKILAWISLSVTAVIAIIDIIFK